MKSLTEMIIKVLNTELNEIDAVLKDDFVNSNKLLRLKVFLSEETGLLQDEINSLSVKRFFELVQYHSLIELINEEN